MNTTTPRGFDNEEAGPAGEPQDPRRFVLRRSTARMSLLFVGVLMVLAGVAMLGYLAWENIGSDVVASRHQTTVLADLRARWQYPTVADVLGPHAAIAPLGTADAVLRVPRFGRDYEVPIIEGVRGSDLATGVGHFPGTGPGQIGNFALAAHRSTYGEPFRDLPKLRPGDTVIVETDEATYTYQLDTNPNRLLVPFSQSWVTDPVPVAPRNEAPNGMPVFDSAEPTDALITLTSSSEAFHPDERMVAFGHLVTTTPK
jgi:sortase A